MVYSSLGTKGQSVKYEENNYWYKFATYEFNSQTEVIASRLLDRLFIDDVKFDNFVKYEFVKVEGRSATKSYSFLGDDEEFITLNAVYRKLNGINLSRHMFEYIGADLFGVVVDLLLELGFDLQDVKDYFSIMLQFDAYVLNEDRHFSNIGLIYDGKKYRFAPLFDFDYCLFARFRTFDMENVRQFLWDKPSLPFFSSHTEQFAFAESLSPKRISFEFCNARQLTRGLWSYRNLTGRYIIEKYLKGKGWR